MTYRQTLKAGLITTIVGGFVVGIPLLVVSIVFEPKTDEKILNSINEKLIPELARLNNQLSKIIPEDPNMLQKNFPDIDNVQESVQEELIENSDKTEKAATITSVAPNEKKEPSTSVTNTKIIPYEEGASYAQEKETKLEPGDQEADEDGTLWTYTPRNISPNNPPKDIKVSLWKSINIPCYIYIDGKYHSMLNEHFLTKPTQYSNGLLNIHLKPGNHIIEARSIDNRYHSRRTVYLPEGNSTMIMM